MTLLFQAQTPRKFPNQRGSRREAKAGKAVNDPQVNASAAAAPKPSSKARSDSACLSDLCLDSGAHTLILQPSLPFFVFFTLLVNVCAD